MQKQKLIVHIAHGNTTEKTVQVPPRVHLIRYGIETTLYGDLKLYELLFDSKTAFTVDRLVAFIEKNMDWGLDFGYSAPGSKVLDQNFSYYDKVNPSNCVQRTMGTFSFTTTTILPATIDVFKNFAYRGSVQDAQVHAETRLYEDYLLQENYMYRPDYVRAADVVAKNYKTPLVTEITLKKVLEGAHSSTNNETEDVFLFVYSCRTRGAKKQTNVRKSLSSAMFLIEYIFRQKYKSEYKFGRVDCTELPASGPPIFQGLMKDCFPGVDPCGGTLAAIRLAAFLKSRRVFYFKDSNSAVVAALTQEKFQDPQGRHYSIVMNVCTRKSHRTRKLMQYLFYMMFASDRAEAATFSENFYFLWVAPGGQFSTLSKYYGKFGFVEANPNNLDSMATELTNQKNNFSSEVDDIKQLFPGLASYNNIATDYKKDIFNRLSAFFAEVQNAAGPQPLFVAYKMHGKNVA